MRPTIVFLMALLLPMLAQEGTGGLDIVTCVNKTLQTNPNLWIHKHCNRYKYLAMHMDNFIIELMEPNKAMKQIKKS